MEDVLMNPQGNSLVYSNIEIIINILAHTPDSHGRIHT